jgi:hypothetical protein
VELLAIIGPETPMRWYRAAFVVIGVGNYDDGLHTPAARGRIVEQRRRDFHGFELGYWRLAIASSPNMMPRALNNT